MVKIYSGSALGGWEGDGVQRKQRPKYRFCSLTRLVMWSKAGDKDSGNAEDMPHGLGSGFRDRVWGVSLAGEAVGRHPASRQGTQQVRGGPDSSHVWRRDWHVAWLKPYMQGGEGGDRRGVAVKLVWATWEASNAMFQCLAFLGKGKRSPRRACSRRGMMLLWDIMEGNVESSVGSLTVRIQDLKRPMCEHTLWLSCSGERMKKRVPCWMCSPPTKTF